MALGVEEMRIREPLHGDTALCPIFLQLLAPCAPVPAPSSVPCVLGTQTLSPTPDGHEHGKQNCPFVVNHVSDLEKMEEECDGAGGDTSVSRGPLVPWSP